MKPQIAIVDPFFSGANFPNLAEEMGYGVVTIRSDEVKELNPLIHSLKKLPIKAVFAGCENGVLLADTLSSTLNLISNGKDLSLARRDKNEMKKVLSTHQVPSAKFISFPKLTPDLIQKWMEKQQQHFPVVLKPALAFGSINVITCKNNSDLSHASKLLNTQDLSPYGVDNTHYLVEEYIDGEEYAINLIGNGKELFITDIWRYDRREFVSGYTGYYSVDLLNPKDNPSLIKILADISLKAASALKIMHGCSHVEVKVNSKGEPKVIEVGARISGGSLARRATTVTHQETELAHIKAFLGLEFTFKPLYSIDKYMIVVYLRNTKSGTIKTIEGVEEIKKLPTYKEMNLNVKLGNRVTPTADLIGSSGMVVLQSKHKEALLYDCERCHALFQLRFDEL
ncbi:MAG: Dapdiamide A synthase [Chlamydiales bacterium]|nr:Dapdiamide A synthase [Chlamydiales bacterium]MCH9620006.1 Dapdiamide A synthase [Chlamydiales bacterium]MCH9622890.1 Dapdiamide A synthase [Chlamydiales bacterium]